MSSYQKNNILFIKITKQVLQNEYSEKMNRDVTIQLNEFGNIQYLFPTK